MLANFNSQQIFFIAILVIAIILFLTEWIRNDIVAVLIVLALYLTRVLKPEEALSGFSSEPAIVIAGIFVLSGALHVTGLSDTIGDWIGRLAGRSYSRAIAVIMPLVALLSAFTHHVTTTAIMVPVTLDLSRERDIPASKLLMPLSFAASLGTTITIIGAPAFLIASNVLRQSGRPGLGVFSIAPIGLSLSLLGTVFMLVAGRFLLPSHHANEDETSHFQLEDYLTELTVLPNSPFLGKTIKEVEDDERYQFKIVGWIRNGKRIKTLSNKRPLQEGDVLVVRTTPEQLVAIRQQPDIELHPINLYGSGKEINEQNGDDEDEDIDDQFVQAVVASGSDLVGRTLGEVDFHQRYGAIVVGLWRKSGWLQQEMAKVKLLASDVLVLEGDRQSLARVANDGAFLMLVPFHGGNPKMLRKAPLAGIIMLAAILAAAFNLMSIEMAALAGAVTTILTGCITVRQAYGSIDRRIFVFIAGAIPLGLAMQKTGTANLLGGWLQRVVGGWHETWILLLLFGVVAIITQFMSDAATTALFAPVAVALAQALGQPPEPFVVTVAMAAVVAFLTPIGHHGNLLVYGPGRYQFSDFVKVGTPLTILVGFVVVLLAPILWHG
ncbi:MAG: SLC13 family permease [Pyrinomonadaceae bacterium]